MTTRKDKQIGLVGPPPGSPWRQEEPVRIPDPDLVYIQQKAQGFLTSLRNAGRRLSGLRATGLGQLAHDIWFGVERKNKGRPDRRPMYSRSLDLGKGSGHDWSWYEKNRYRWSWKKSRKKR